MRRRLPRAAKLLAKAERPLIVVGGGALDAGAEVQAVAEAVQAPVSSFRRGRGVIPTTHPLAVSFTEGHALVEERRCGAGDRHAALLAAERLGRR